MKNQPTPQDTTHQAMDISCKHLPHSSQHPSGSSILQAHLHIPFVVLCRDSPIPSKGTQHHTDHSWALLNWLFQHKLGFTWPWRPEGNFLLCLLSPGEGLHILVIHPVPMSSFLLTFSIPSLQKGSHTVKAD